MIPASKVIVQNAVDESIYFVDGVEYTSVPTLEREARIVFVGFTPSNGHNKGELHRVPLSRVISIIGGEEA